MTEEVEQDIGRSSWSNGIKNNFGSKRGALKYFVYWFALRLGGFRAYRSVDFALVRRLVLVCSGNICRSSFGEYAAKSLDYPAISYGLHCTDGNMADQRAIAYAESCGFVMHAHRTQNIRHYSYSPGDLVVAMEPAHLRELARVLPGKAMVTAVALWGKPVSAYLHDPYCSNSIFFENCERRVYTGIKELVKNARNAG